jgi:hypothetical protein
MKTFKQFTEAKSDLNDLGHHTSLKRGMFGSSAVMGKGDWLLDMDQKNDEGAPMLVTIRGLDNAKTIQKKFGGKIMPVNPKKTGPDSIYRIKK